MNIPKLLKSHCCFLTLNHCRYEARIRDIRSRIADAMEQSAGLSENIEKLTKEREVMLASNMEEAQAHEVGGEILKS